jgi:Ca2+-transporting ATPase
LYPPSQAHHLLQLGVLCNSATSHGATFTGDPLEVALLRKAQVEGINAEVVRRTTALRDEFTFDTTRKRMSVVLARGDQAWVIVKGAPEAVLARCACQLIDGEERALGDHDRQAGINEADRMAVEGLRVIALAEKTVPGDYLSQDEAESQLTFVGLAGLADPPRPEVKAAITACRTAGIRPIMITGDHPLTARAVAEQIGLDGNGCLLTGADLDTLSDKQLSETVGQVSLYARTTPEHKLRIVRTLHERSARVAVTGDGINDAPALAAADIGVAMGETGTDVARSAAALVLAHDNFTTIVNAIKEGRVLFANLTKGVRYYLACKVALVSATLLPVLLHIPVPFAPIQIILMELFMDLAASATFVNEPAEANLMRCPPRDPEENFMNRRMVTSIFRSAAGLFAAVSVAYLVTWYTTGNLVRSQTVAFVTWLLGHLLLAINLRSEHEPLFRLGFFSNRLMIIWGLATVIFLLFVTFMPGVQSLLKIMPLRAEDWLLALIVSLVGTCWIEARKLLSWQR